MESIVYNQDCMIGMAKYPDKYFDLAVVDPPYRDTNQPTKDMRKSGSMKSLEGRPQKEYFNELSRVSKNQIIWGANNFELPQFKGFIVWDKGIPMDFTMSMAELASISEGLGTISKVFQFRVAGAENRIHPTQKPIKLYEWIYIKYLPQGGKVIDTHLGSGSNRIAADKAGNIDFIGFELDKDYFEAQEKRWVEYKKQLVLW
jgi:site-specific DNA-methyltransferase (adenine-specific)